MHRIGARRTVLAWALACGAALFLTPRSVGAEQQRQPAELSGQEAQPEPQDTRVGELFRWLNFLLICGTLGYFAAKHAPPVFRARAEIISEEIAKARREKAAADERLGEAAAALAHLDQEMAAMREAAASDFRAEAERLERAGQQELERIEHVAELEIEASARAAQLELRALAARLAVEHAEALLRQRLTPERRAVLFQRFVASLPASAATP